jgi:signal transduction histidine kinase
MAAVAVATAATSVIYSSIAPSTSLLFFPAVVVPAIYGGYGPGLLATLLSTLSLAYFFLRPVHSLAIGIDDGIRLAAFAAVAFSTAWLGSARRRAEEAERQSVEELRSAIDTLRKIGDWPVVGSDLPVSVRIILEQAAAALGADVAKVVWETDEEPWIYCAGGAEEEEVSRISRSAGSHLIAEPLQSATFLTANPIGHASVVMSAGGSQAEWVGTAIGPGFPLQLTPSPMASAPFRTEHVQGRVFISGVAAGPKAIPATELVAREVGNSLEQLHLAARARELAVREDRLRVSRDLHDGVLQALTGIRLELQGLADGAEQPQMRDRLVAIERALATEQRELRLFIDGLRPSAVETPPESLATRLDAMCVRLATEWRVPIGVRVTPRDLVLPPAIEESVRLMVHEAVINALKHGHPSRVAVAVDARSADVQVAVSDDGGGFAMRGSFDQDALARANLGPVSLRERVTALNGSLRIESTANGSRVNFSIPLPAAAPSEKPALLG